MYLTIAAISVACGAVIEDIRSGDGAFSRA